MEKARKKRKKNIESFDHAQDRYRTRNIKIRSEKYKK